MKKKKIIIITSVLCCLICVSIAYLMKKTCYQNQMRFSFNYKEIADPTAKEISTMAVSKYNELKIRFNVFVNEGAMQIALYYVPEDHLLYKRRYASFQESIRMIESGEDSPEKRNVDGLECVYQCTVSETACIEIDTKDYKDGLYAIVTYGTADSDIQGTMSIDYVYRNWMKFANKIRGYDIYRP